MWGCNAHASSMSTQQKGNTMYYLIDSATNTVMASSKNKDFMEKIQASLLHSNHLCWIRKELLINETTDKVQSRTHDIGELSGILAY